MFFNNNSENIKILDMLDMMEKYLKDELNSLPQQNFVCSRYNKQIKNKLDSIYEILNEKNNQELEIYGEIMLDSEKISDGILDDKIHHTNTSNFKLNYIAKTINSLVDALSTNMKEMLDILRQYQDNNYVNILNENKVKNDFNLLYEGINRL